MDLDTFRWLLTEEGQALLRLAGGLDMSDAGQLRALTALRAKADPQHATAAYDIAHLRRKAAAKFPRSEAMYFTQEALEQASGAIISAHRAKRYARFERVADLCCSVGSDALGIAGASEQVHVTGIDLDPLRLAMARANAAAYGLSERTSWLEQDLERVPPPDADALFFDPARRQNGTRAFRAKDYRPPLHLLDTWRKRIPNIGAKLAPGIQDEEVGFLGRDQIELEFISVDGELKEAVLWAGGLAEPGKRATVLRAGGGFSTLHSSAPLDPAAVAAPGAFLYEPDPAMIRAQLVGALAVEVRGALLDPHIAYVTAAEQVETPFARCWRVLEWMPFHLKKLRARLRALDGGTITVKKRGSPIDTDKLARELRGDGARELVVVLTFADGNPAALVCEGPV